MSGNLAYLGTVSGLHRIDLSDPAHPRATGFFGAPGITAVALDGDLAYALDGDRDLYTIDLSHPERLAAICHLNGLYAGDDLVVRNGRAYVADDLGGLTLVDLSDPARPRFIGCDLTVPDVTDVAVSGQHAFVVDGRGYLLQGEHCVYVAEGHFQEGKVGGLRSVDLAAAPTPRLLGRAEVEGRGWRVVLDNSRAIVTSDHEVCAVDISSPARPRRTGRLPGDGPHPGQSPRKVLAVGNRLYIAREDLLSIVALRTNRRAETLGHYEAAGGIVDLAVAGNIAYLATPDVLQAVSVARPRHPELLGSLSIAETDDAAINCLSMEGSLVYLMVEVESPIGDSGLRIVDVSDARNPRPLGATHAGCCGMFRRIVVEGTLAYVAAWDCVSLLDVAEPSHPREIQRYNLDDREDWVSGAALSEGRFYVACGNNGLLVFELESASPPGPR